MNKDHSYIIKFYIPNVTIVEKVCILSYNKMVGRYKGSYGKITTHTSHTHTLFAPIFTNCCLLALTRASFQLYRHNGFTK